MYRPTLAALLLGSCLAALCHGAESPVKPFDARYQVEWKGINAGTSELVLAEDGKNGAYSYISRTNARGIFRLFLGNEIKQTSAFEMDATSVRPLIFRSDDGSSKTDQDVSLDFDWPAGRVRGTSENKAVDLPLKPGVQDLMSVQIAAMLDLLNNRLAPVYLLADKDEIKEYVYTKEGAVKLGTSIGEFDTVIVTSQRRNSDRKLRMWFAPALGYVPVRAERSRNGKVEITMRIKNLKR
jgi:Protein of unknown function (DUF3108)